MDWTLICGPNLMVDQILNIFKRINKMDLSKDASEILDILLLTNAYYP